MPTASSPLHIAFVYPSGKMHKTIEEQNSRIQELEKKNFQVTTLEPSISSENNVTAGAVLERAALLSHALTNRKFHILMAARGGYGTTELIPFLLDMLPPVLPPKTLVGFSDISYIGVYLSLKYQNFRYIHARNGFSEHLFSDENSESTVLFSLLEKETQIKENTFECRNFGFKSTEGVCLPLNLSLAESLASTKDIVLPSNSILFLEDCNEYLYRLLRKFDSLVNSSLWENVIGIVLGDFTQILDQNNEAINRDVLFKLISHKLRKPLLDFPFFGHGTYCFPLVACGKVLIQVQNENNAVLTLFQQKISLESALHTKQSHKLMKDVQKIHLCGIGGTGMASVAGLLKYAGYQISGSDSAIYPPMDRVLANLNIVPNVGFKKENIDKHAPDAIIMGNVMSRKTAALAKNEELETILERTIPVMSFPSALRHLFLQNSINFVVSGTHGKTTTSSLLTYLLNGLGYQPSFLIGGMPANFGQGFGLNSKDLFVLEGDEYDSAFFDKGPKFLHYEPKITLINNIEFDHADIYPNIEAIEAEFLNLAALTKARKGFNIINCTDQRALRIIKQVGGDWIGFTDGAQKEKSHSSKGLWVLTSFDTVYNGINIHFKAPNEKQHSIFIAQMFGLHSAMNALGVLASIHAYYLLNQKTLDDMLIDMPQVAEILKDFKGVKRRFELLAHHNHIAVFDDFAHHPTAIRTTLQAFRDYIELLERKGRLIVCFDPHNATMRRSVLQNELAESFSSADILFLGRIPRDLRMDQNHVLNGEKVVKICGIKAYSFDENQKLLAALLQEVQPNDTVVFMSSGSFDGISSQFVHCLAERKN